VISRYGSIQAPLELSIDDILGAPQTRRRGDPCRGDVQRIDMRND